MGETNGAFTTAPVLPSPDLDAELQCLLYLVSRDRPSLALGLGSHEGPDAIATTKDASVIFDALLASAGPGVSSSENHKNCVVSFAVT